MADNPSGKDFDSLPTNVINAKALQSELDRMRQAPEEGRSSSSDAGATQIVERPVAPSEDVPEASARQGGRTLPVALVGIFGGVVLGLGAGYGIFGMSAAAEIDACRSQLVAITAAPGAAPTGPPGTVAGAGTASGPAAAEASGPAPSEVPAAASGPVAEAGASGPAVDSSKKGKAKKAKTKKAKAVE